MARALADPAPGAPQPRANALEAELTNLDAVTFDLDRARLSSRWGAEVRVTTDTEVSVKLVGVGWRTRIKLDGAGVGSSWKGRARVTVPPGTHTISIG